MRRGHTLMELLVSLAVLAMLGSVTLRLMFAGDNALQAQTARATANSAALRLLHDVSDDLRASSSAGSGETLTIERPDGRVVYQALPQERAVRRTARDVVEDYPGVTLHVSGGGRLRTLTVTGKTLTLSTVACSRRGGS
jgi:prepilin-type N-terminal cleavage/methylation domain-containing protein